MDFNLVLWSIENANLRLFYRSLEAQSKTKNETLGFIKIQKLSLVTFSPEHPAYTFRTLGGAFKGYFLDRILASLSLPLVEREK